VIFDYADQQNVVKDCLKELNLSDKNFPPKSILEMIGRAKDELITPDSYLKCIPEISGWRRSPGSMSFIKEAEAK